MISKTWPPAGETRFRDELAALYSDMDDNYRAASARYRFVCRGCTDNCCLTRFHHHTHLEYFYLRDGFLALDDPVRSAVTARAAEYDARQNAAGLRGETPRIMCPLNSEGRCLLYAHRPMICRLHGIPHELAPPGRPRQYGEGCGEFRKCCGDMPYVVFDRTPFYTDMAALERRLREAAGTGGKMKMTIARMLLDISADLERGGETP